MEYFHITMSLLFLLLATVVKSRKCYENITDVSNVIKGDFKDSRDRYIGSFARTNNRMTWFIDACPVEVIFRACYLDVSQEHAILSEDRTFQTTECDLDKFKPETFLERSRSKKLLFIGDSLSLQTWIAIVCSLHSTEISAVYNIEWFNFLKFYNVPEWENDVCFHGLPHCYIKSGSVYYPQYNATIMINCTHFDSLHGFHSLSNIADNWSMGSNDVMILNYGMHFDPTTMEKVLKNVIEEIVKLQLSQDSPVVVWRETMPAHFNGLVGYTSDPINGNCSGYNDLELAYSSDYKNRMADKIFSKAGIPILRVAQNLFSEWYSHFGREFMLPRHHLDCVHYCNPSGALDHIRDLIFNMLAVLET